MDVMFGLYDDVHCEEKYVTYYNHPNVVYMTDDINDDWHVKVTCQVLWLMDKATSITFNLNRFDKAYDGYDQQFTRFELALATLLFNDKITNENLDDEADLRRCKKDTITMFRRLVSLLHNSNDKQFEHLNVYLTTLEGV